MTTKNQTAIAYFAGGCFWGLEHLLRKQAGVIDLEVGFMGGKTANPTYEEVYQELTGHAETVKIIFDPEMVGYETLAKYFFEIHDPTQLNRQGPDAGKRYRSEIFYTSSEQKEIAEKLIHILKSKDYDVITRLTPASVFYPAENYHQRYYEKTGNLPYCHLYTPRF
jgi:peptide methionine sulfoxide reductase msrA/msrB